MAKFVFIHSRDPYESRGAADFVDMAKGAAENGDTSVLFLVQDSVLSARKGTEFGDQLTKLSGSISVMADGLALKERGVTSPADGVEVVGIDELVKLVMEPGTKALWR